MAPLGANQKQPDGPAEIVSDLWQLIRDYAKQETVDPLKSIGRFLKLGIPGAVLLTLGLLFGVLAILRVLQAEAGIAPDGNFTWVPYFAALLFAGVGAGLAVVAIRRPGRDDPRP